MAYYFTVKIMAVPFSKISGNIYQTARFYIPENNITLDKKHMK
jgi:hypothetical protein